MSILYPVIFQYTKPNNKPGLCPLFVNPTQIKIEKTASNPIVRTLGTNVVAPWHNMLDNVTMSGTLYGIRSFLDMTAFQRIIDCSPDKKLVHLKYKWKKYPVFVNKISIGADAEKPRTFDYSIDMVSLEPFSLRRMMIGQIPSVYAELDFLEGVINSTITAAVSNSALDNRAALAQLALATTSGGGDILDVKTKADALSAINSDGD